MNIKQIVSEIEFHDSYLEAVQVDTNGSVQLFFDIDEVWNKDLDPNVKGILLKSVYEISDFKIDRLNVISDVAIKEIDYNKDFVVHLAEEKPTAIMLTFDFVAGGSLTIICDEEAELLITKN